jgi:hypothetical protein
MTIHQNLIAGEWVGKDAIRNINPSHINDVVGERCGQGGFPGLVALRHP